MFPNIDLSRVKSIKGYIGYKATVLIIAALLAYPAFLLQEKIRPEETWRHPPVSPRLNADGTVDYVLISMSKGFKGHYVVLRFAKDQFVDTGNQIDPTKNGVAKENAKTPTGLTNSFLTAYYGQDWMPISSALFSKMNFRQWVEILFDESETLNTEEIQKKLSDAKTACAEPEQYSMGVTEYRLKPGRDPGVEPYCFSSSFTTTRNKRAYVLREPAALFNCESPSANGDTPGRCDGEIRSSANLRARVEFYTFAEPTPQSVQYAAEMAKERILKAYVGSGEIQPSETFSFFDFVERIK